MCFDIWLKTSVCVVTHGREGMKYSEEILRVSQVKVSFYFLEMLHFNLTGYSSFYLVNLQR